MLGMVYLAHKEVFKKRFGLYFERIMRLYFHIEIVGISIIQ